jgi:hypothetical protein
MLKNGQLDDAMAGIDPLQLRPVNPRGFGAAEEGKIMAVAMPLAVSMTVIVSGSSMQLARGGNGDPAAEADQGHAGGGVDEMAEFSGDGDAGKPDHRGDNQC